MKPAGALLLAALVFAPSAPGQQPSPSPGENDSDRARLAGSEVPAPKRTKLVRPEYPPAAIARGMRGIVILELIIDPQGKVASAVVTRNVPGAPEFDQAALSAVRQWEYEPTKVDGRPVSVRLTVPITFAMRLPELERETGIPELRQGAPPALPSAPAFDRPATVVAEVTLDAQGQVAEARILQGEMPWSEALLQALRTWRFAAESSEAVISFRVQADFIPGRDKEPARLNLRASGLRRSETIAQAGPTAPPGGSPPVAESPAPARSPSAPATPPPAAAPSPAPAPSPGPPEPTATPSPASPGPRPSAAVPPAAAAPAPPPARPGASVPSAQAPASPAPTPRPTPPIEVIGGLPPAGGITPPSAPPPDQPGVSAVRDVVLGIGVPDLAKGRRPVVPPLARMSETGGTVEVEFSVDAAGQASVREVRGPDLLKRAAEQTVASWVFRRMEPTRLFMVARIVYTGDTARAEVAPSR